MAKSNKSLFAENFERKHGIAWEYKGERLDRAKMDELKKLAELKEAGILTEEEFNEQKAKLLN